MQFINTHSHVYTEAFDLDRDEMISRAISKGITTILLPDIDSTERARLEEVTKKYPSICLPMLGVHPTSIKKNYKQELDVLENLLTTNKYIGIGEIGIDLYWDKTFIKEQIEAFTYQIHLANTYNLPVAIHVRNSFNEIFTTLDSIKNINYKGVFHCFSGNLEQSYKAIDLGFSLGIGGVVTYKKSGLDEIIQKIPLEHIVLETDDPWLPPVPYRGQRNEPSYIIEIAEKIATIKQLNISKVAEITTSNSKLLFSL